MSGKRNRPEKDTSFEEQEAIYRKSKIAPRSPKEQENMEEIKKMLQEFQWDIKREIEGIKLEIRESIKEVKDDIRELKEQLKENRENMEAIKNEISEIKRSDRKEKGEMKGKIDCVEKRLEMIEKDKIRNNLIVSGIDIDGQKGEQVKKTMQVMLDKELGVRAEIKRASRINNKKCVIVMEEWRGKIEILKEKKKLKGGYIFIDSDLTKKEREIQKKIRDRAGKEREGGRRTKVGYKKLYIDGREYTWDEQNEELVIKKGSLTKN